MFGKWKTIVATILGAAIACMGMPVLCGCLIPCVRELGSKALESAVTQQMVRYEPIPDSDQWDERYMPPGMVDDDDQFDPDDPQFKTFLSSNV